MVFGSRVCTWIVAATAFVAVLVAAPARADEASDLERGRQLYVEGKHAEAESFLSRAIDGAIPSIREGSLVQRGRMIRGASAMYLGKRDQAVVQFEAILRANPKFDPDPLAFPAGVLEEFKKQRERIEREEAVKGSATIVKLLDEERDRRKKLEAKYEALKTFATEERVITRSSRIIATIPFGVGQFQNGDTSLGVFFAASQGITLGVAVAAYVIHARLPDPRSETVVDTDQARTIELSSRLVNIVSFGAFAALAIGGIVQAHIAYVPEKTEKRVRILPPAFALSPIIAPSPTGLTLGVSGAF